MSHPVNPHPDTTPVSHEKWIGSLILLIFVLVAFLPLVGQNTNSLIPFLDRVNAMPGSGWRENFATYFVAIVLEGAPYMILSACAGAIIELLVPPQWLPRTVKRLGGWGLPAVVALSPLFPICECGIGFVARRLLRMGLPLPHTLSFLLAAPILNPLVLAGTWMAYGQNWIYPLLRALGAILVSLAVGFWFYRLNASVLAFRPDDPGLSACSHAGCDHAHPKPTLGARMHHVLTHTREDFLDTGLYFLFGVFVASLLKTFVDPSQLDIVGREPLLGPAIMMLMAFTLSLCAGADAFVAASFSGFLIPSHTAFLVLGPMLDIKLLFMYRTLFQTGFIVRLSLAILLAVSGYVAVLQLLPTGWLDHLAFTFLG
ncbi:MAG: permease [Magnetococcales bacterium]|nr:permease [Magnetococcales bacterium]MBF0260334.1 permease [Magnetococcales bacterium]